MELSAKFSPEELELKNKYKLLRRLKRSVDKLSSIRKRHFVCQNDADPSVTVQSAEDASSQLRTQLLLKPKRSQTITEGFKRPECWSRLGAEKNQQRPKDSKVTKVKTPKNPTPSKAKNAAGRPKGNPSTPTVFKPFTQPHSYLYVERPTVAPSTVVGRQDDYTLEDFDTMSCEYQDMFSYQAEEMEEEVDSQSSVEYVQVGFYETVAAPGGGCENCDVEAPGGGGENEEEVEAEITLETVQGDAAEGYENVGMDDVQKEVEIVQSDTEEVVVCDTVDDKNASLESDVAEGISTARATESHKEALEAMQSVAALHYPAFDHTRRGLYPRAVFGMARFSEYRIQDEVPAEEETEEAPSSNIQRYGDLVNNTSSSDQEMDDGDGDDEFSLSIVF